MVDEASPLRIKRTEGCIGVYLSYLAAALAATNG